MNGSLPSSPRLASPRTPARHSPPPLRGAASFYSDGADPPSSNKAGCPRPRRADGGKRLPLPRAPAGCAQESVCPRVACEVSSSLSDPDPDLRNSTLSVSPGSEEMRYRIPSRSSKWMTSTDAV
ncbi:E3 ubiquitin-protein ligase RNF182 isoform X2 [Numida meleagris]|uniref:E3 ubiquitin-protein ligase RNF182 isoform X2 n=1 Tax=Numida meleagris TaxID=8996 RepID=UPI000B3DA5A8|nr:E3 ubiquitin-protein ligase RNF182 isoform X2 [Numida meleagris]